MTSYDPTRTAVIAVHLQGDIVGADGALAPFFRAEIERTGVLDQIGHCFDGARATGMKVIYTRVAFQPGYPDLIPNSPLLAMTAQHSCLVDGTPGAAIVDELAPQPGDVVITHTRITGFHSSSLDVLLRGSGIDTVIFVGVATNLSVEGTARIASDMGFRTVVVGDACSAATADGPPGVPGVAGPARRDHDDRGVPVVARCAHQRRGRRLTGKARPDLRERGSALGARHGSPYRARRCASPSRTAQWLGPWRAGRRGCPRGRHVARQAPNSEAAAHRSC